MLIVIVKREGWGYSVCSGGNCIWLRYGNTLPLCIMSKTKFITTEEYSKAGYKTKPVSQQAIRKAIKYNRKHLLPGVINIHKSGKYHLLEVAN